MQCHLELLCFPALSWIPGVELSTLPAQQEDVDCLVLQVPVELASLSSVVSLPCLFHDLNVVRIISYLCSDRLRGA